MEPTGVRAYNTWHSSTDASKLVHQKDLENSLVGRYQFQSEKVMLKQSQLHPFPHQTVPALRLGFW